MKTKQRWWSGVLLALVLGFSVAGAPQAQTTTTTAVNKFEIIAVDGNNLVVRNEKGTHQYVVCAARIAVRGRQSAILRSDWKGAAPARPLCIVQPPGLGRVPRRERSIADSAAARVNDCDCRSALFLLAREEEPQKRYGDRDQDVPDPRRSLRSLRLRRRDLCGLWASRRGRT